MPGTVKSARVGMQRAGVGAAHSRAAMIRERDAPAGVGCVAVVGPSIGKLYTHST
jgi:hypothetical protein